MGKLKTKTLSLHPDAALLVSSKMRLCVFNDLADVTSTLHAATTKSVSTRILNCCLRSLPNIRVRVFQQWVQIVFPVNVRLT